MLVLFAARIGRRNMSSEKLTRSYLFRVFCKHGVKAFAVQLVVMLLTVGIVFIPVINWFAPLLAVLVTILYIPWIKLMELTNLFPQGYMTGSAIGGWLLGALIYSLAWAAIKTWVVRKRLGVVHSASNNSFNRSAD